MDIDGLNSRDHATREFCVATATTSEQAVPKDNRFEILSRATHLGKKIQAEQNH